MRKTYLMLNNAKKLSRENQKNILGGEDFTCPPNHYTVNHNGYTACCLKPVSNPCELTVNFCLMPMGMCNDGQY
ncbi:hypothetical protein KRE40_00020 [Elizabethkingia meningoseptica]|uniref:hypothetical protein n=1 Tax=Elizabethkingia meningoseptica TaxID=238 RepID=UPI000936635D|nr:hypothetical protein [Elizabethkingia meningoseptica]MCL1677343.1 hypothetical protein [Elizabethkingia meningoseptica]MCL1688082.1 hypothetical protein [Elizabethkingia meningoseptica]MDE5437934.1 hypothetical protein [Elizabethkingia meningoseptica]MDE5489906.1 hypothetical protein [Elizabethkingia meningoseptica]MDE5493623.1 hypothetical protein [Elizabethkingia meningoseptica]